MDEQMKAAVETAGQAVPAQQLPHVDPVVFLSQWFRRRPQTPDREQCLRALTDIAAAIDQLQRQNEYSQKAFNELMDRDERYSTLVENISRLLSEASRSVPSEAPK